MLSMHCSLSLFVNAKLKRVYINTRNVWAANSSLLFLSNMYVAISNVTMFLCSTLLSFRFLYCFRWTRCVSVMVSSNLLQNSTETKLQQSFTFRSHLMTMSGVKRFVYQSHFPHWLSQKVGIENKQIRFKESFIIEDYSYESWIMTRAWCLMASLEIRNQPCTKLKNDCDHRISCWKLQSIIVSNVWHLPNEDEGHSIFNQIKEILLESTLHSFKFTFRIFVRDFTSVENKNAVVTCISNQEVHIAFYKNAGLDEDGYFAKRCSHGFMLAYTAVCLQNDEHCVINVSLFCF